jgi:hypothetical protein
VTSLTLQVMKQPRRSPFTPFFVSLLIATTGQSFAQSPTWSERMDLLTAGAAASVVAHQICEGSDAGRFAASQASLRLMNEANALEGAGTTPQAAYAYAADSYSMKIKAMWQANSSNSCQSLRRLQDLARSTGFSAP